MEYRTNKIGQIGNLFMDYINKEAPQFEKDEVATLIATKQYATLMEKALEWYKINNSTLNLDEDTKLEDTVKKSRL